MTATVSKSPSNDAALRHYLLPFQPFMDMDTVSEICVNDAGRTWILNGSDWEVHRTPEVDDKHLIHLGRMVATYAKSVWDSNNPILSASMPDGSRIQMVSSPAVEAHRTSFTMRRQTHADPFLSDYSDDVFFNGTTIASNDLKDYEKELIKTLKEKNYRKFIQLAMANRLNIVCSGATGSGKTTFMKALVKEIPLEERLITIEDVRELFIPHQNAVHLLYTGVEDRNGRIITTHQDLLKSCLRMKPDRILLAELRSEECLYFLRSAASGHPGSLTSLHGGSAEEAFEQMVIMVLESEAGANLDYRVIRRLLDLTIHVVLQFGNDGNGRYLSEVYYNPEKKYEAIRNG